MKKLFLTYNLPLLSALLLAMAFYLPQAGLIAWFALCPLLIRLFNHRYNAFKQGLCFGISFYLLLAYSLLALHPIEGLTAAASLTMLLLLWLLIGLIYGGTVALACYLIGKLPLQPLAQVLGAAALWLLLEKLLGMGILGFPWARLGVSQFFFPALIQSAALFGALGLSAVILLVNALLAQTIMARQAGRGCYRFLLCSVLIFAGNLAYGGIILSLPAANEQATARISVVQTNLASGADSTFTSADVLQEYTKLAKEAVVSTQPDLLVLPETALPNDLQRGSSLERSYLEMIENTSTALLVGAYTWREGRLYNALFYGEQGVLNEVYAKRHLVPMGEFIPLRTTIERLFPSLGNLMVQQDDVTSGTSAAAFETKIGNAAGIICFESIFPELLQESVAQGAGYIVLLTNDSWFRGTAAVYQHLGQSALRAVEYGKPLIRAANAGYSALIDSKGRIYQTLDPHENGFLTGNLQPCYDRTIYASCGDIPLLLISLISLLAICLRRRHFK